MKGRIEAMAVSFALGALCGAAVLSRTGPYIAEIIPFFPLSCTCLAAVLFIDGKPDRLYWILICLGFFLSGAAGGAAGPGTGLIPPGFASGWAASFSGQIDSIPFRNPLSAPLVKALTLGDRSGLPRDTVILFRSSGAAHLLALSGLHLGIIYLILRRLTFPLGNSPRARHTRSLILVVLTLLYVLGTGASPSITRAFLFILIGEAASLSGRRTKASKVFATALLLQLLISTESIRSVGFQLSYSAVAGIVIFYRRLSEWFPRVRKAPLASLMKRIWDMAVLTLCCQVFTAPLAWYRFHSFPQFFLLTNLMAIPLTTALIAVSLAVTLMSMTGWTPEAGVLVTDTLTGALLNVLGIISGLQSGG